MRSKPLLRVLVAGHSGDLARGAARNSVWSQSLAYELFDGRVRAPAQIRSVLLAADESDRSVVAVRADARRFHPDVVIVQMTVADIPRLSDDGMLSFSALKTLERDVVIRPLLELLMRPAIAGPTVARYVKILHRRAVDRDALQPAAAEYRAIARAASAVGARTILAFVATQSACPDARATDEDADRRARAVATAARLPFVDLSRGARAGNACHRCDGASPDDREARPSTACASTNT